MPEYIVNWNFASDDWHCPRSKNDLRVGGKFSATMAARIVVVFDVEQEGVRATETFDAEDENSIEMQRSGWQSILDSFAKYTASVGSAT